MLNHVKTTGWLMLAAMLAMSATQVGASGRGDFEVTITNLTYRITFTPILVASHRRPVAVFEAGTPASDDLAAIAEAGDVGPLTTTLNHERHVIDVQNSGGLLGPGESVTVIVRGGHGARYISVASMMLPTNDGFIGLNSVDVGWRGTRTFYSPGYDAGSEANDELCANIPGPTCGGVGPSPGNNEGDEGFIHVHRGIHGVGDLSAAVYDWRNPVARITVSRLRGKTGH